VGKQYELDIRLAKRLPKVLADPGQIEQILLNLCLNASQAMESGGVIRILTGEVSLTAADTARCVPYDAKPGRYVKLAVTDSGHGMDKDTIMRVFDPFFTTKSEGHGLGLAAVLGILRQHRAVAAIDSTIGKGSTIHIFFPVPENELQTDKRSPRRKRPTKSTGAGQRKKRRGSS
jgi:signal transduction histidine kinase